MSRRIGRNETCPCGSGKKYKKCCLNKKGSPNEIFPPNSEQRPFISRLAIMRIIEQESQDEKKLFEKYGTSDSNIRNIREVLAKQWTFKKLQGMSTKEILNQLEQFQIRFDEDEFLNHSANSISAIKLADKYYCTQNHIAKGLDEEFIPRAIIELWKRLTPRNYNVEMIDEAIQEGYEFLKTGEYKELMSKWELAWTMIKSIVPQDITSVEEADEFMPERLTQSIHNWCQDFEMESHNAGRDDKKYFEKRSKYCHEFTSLFPDSSELIIINMYNAEAESYAHLGDIEKAEALYKGLIKIFPKNVWGYVHWGDIYYFNIGQEGSIGDLDKAESIYKLGLTKCKREKDVLIDRIKSIEKKRIEHAELMNN